MKLHQIVEVSYEEYRKITSGENCYLFWEKCDCNGALQIIGGNIYHLHCSDNPEEGLVPFKGNHKDLIKLLTWWLIGPIHPEGVLTLWIVDRYTQPVLKIP